jgi:3-oxoacyl-[acyl-carrier protein] reductase
MEKELTGQIALVTGAGRGIGLATALALAQRGAGIAINDIEADAADAALALVEAMGAEALACPGDISDPVQVKSMIEATVARFERLDILVNNAGIGGRGLTLLELTLDEWERFLKIDLTGVFLCCQAAVPLMMRRGGGKIVNLSSIFGLSGAAGSIPYSAAKAGVIGLTHALARELAPHRINVNAVAPGLIDTAMSRTRGTVDSMRAQVPWPRIGRPEDVAEIIAFLVSARAEFITGQVISPNGGAHM